MQGTSASQTNLSGHYSGAGRTSTRSQTISSASAYTSSEEEGSQGSLQRLSEHVQHEDTSGDPLARLDHRQNLDFHLDFGAQNAWREGISNPGNINPQDLHVLAPDTERSPKKLCLDNNQSMSEEQVTRTSLGEAVEATEYNNFSARRMHSFPSINEVVSQYEPPGLPIDEILAYELQSKLLQETVQAPGPLFFNIDVDFENPNSNRGRGLLKRGRDNEADNLNPTGVAARVRDHQDILGSGETQKPRRRMPFSDPSKRSETSRTRKLVACVRCHMQRIRVRKSKSHLFYLESDVTSVSQIRTNHWVLV